MQKYRVAVIGCGAVSKNHGKALMNSVTADLRYAVDISLEKAEAFSRTFGGEVLTDYRQLFSRGDVDVVHIVTPHHWPKVDVDKNELKDIISRLQEYMIKAIREAKENSSWVNIDAEYEDAVCNFINKVLTAPKKHPFWGEFIELYQNIYLTGYVNSVSQNILKITSPGVPDIYQGTEVLNLKLVDPDNRKNVNYEDIWKLYEKLNPLISSQEKISNIETFKELEDGALKLYITHQALNFRKDNPDLFNKGSYIPLEAIGEKTSNIVAFARVYKEKAIITVVPIMIYGQELPTGSDFWQNTEIILPDELKSNKWHDIYTKNDFEKQESLKASKILNILPVATLCKH